MCGQVHCLHSLLPPATNYSVRHCLKGHHPFELSRYNYDPSRKSFVVRSLYENKVFKLVWNQLCGFHNNSSELTHPNTANFWADFEKRIIDKATDEWQNDCGAVSMPKDSI